MLSMTTSFGRFSHARRTGAELARYGRPIVLVLLPFAAGYYLSYLFRNINALVAIRLREDFAVDASHLGLMTSVYFLAFALAQLPIGVLLDRYGPRRVQSALLLAAAAGAGLFAVSHRLGLLVAGRALIGLGVAGALIAGLKAVVLWFPKERTSLVNGCFIMLGSVGAISATLPAEWVLSHVGWRGLFEVLAIATLAIAVLIFAVVPEPPQGVADPQAPRSSGLWTIYADARFWRVAPLSMMCISTSWALQGLWAAPWLADIGGLERPAIVRHLFVMAGSLSAGALVIGVSADRLRKRGLRLETALFGTACALVAAEAALIAGLRMNSYLPWAVIGAVGAATVLSYTILGDYFPKELAGRANAALNILHIGGAFALQETIGLVISRWTDIGGHYPPIAYKAALALATGLQVVAMIWFLRPDARRRSSRELERKNGDGIANAA
jgi:MFS family permease